MVCWAQRNYPLSPHDQEEDHRLTSFHLRTKFIDFPLLFIPSNSQQIPNPNTNNFSWGPAHGSCLLMATLLYFRTSARTPMTGGPKVERGPTCQWVTRWQRRVAKPQQVTSGVRSRAPLVTWTLPRALSNCRWGRAGFMDRDRDALEGWPHRAATWRADLLALERSTWLAPPSWSPDVCTDRFSRLASLAWWQRVPRGSRSATFK